MLEILNLSEVPNLQYLELCCLESSSASFLSEILQSIPSSPSPLKALIIDVSSCDSSRIETILSLDSLADTLFLADEGRKFSNLENVVFDLLDMSHPLISLIELKTQDLTRKGVIVNAVVFEQWKKNSKGVYHAWI